MNKVAIVGIGHTKFGRLKDKGLMDLLCEASLEAIENSNTSKKDFDSVYVGAMSPGAFSQLSGIASALVDKLSLLPAAADHIKNGPASGGSAIKTGFQAIASGMSDLVLVVCGEKMTHVTTPGFITSNVATLQIAHVTFYAEENYNLNHKLDLLSRQGEYSVHLCAQSIENNHDSILIDLSKVFVIRS